MKIIHIITRLIIGGAQEDTLLSCQGQHDLGDEVTLVTGPAVGPEGSLMERALSYGYRVVVLDELGRPISPRKDFRGYGRVGKLIEEIGPDVVHTHSSKAGIIGRWAAHRANVPVIVHTIHGLAFTASRSWIVNGVYKALERHTAPITTRIVCVADAMRDQSLAAKIGTAGQYVTIYSGMETGPFIRPGVSRGEVRESLGLSDEHVVVGTIARLFEMKGHEDLLELAPELCRGFPLVRFLWVGDGVLRESFEGRMREMGLRDRFILTGMVAPGRVPELAGAMDLLVHPSRREGLARALPQAGLAGLAAITYDIDGAKEAVMDRETGFVIPALDRAKLFDAMVVLIRDGSLRAEMGRRGREFALGRFDAAVMVRQLEDLYMGLVPGVRPVVKGG